MNKIQKVTVLTFVIMALIATPVLGLLVSNQLKVEGSSTVYPISLSADSSFETKMGGGFLLLPAAGGSGAGFSRLLSQPPTIDVGASSRLPKASEWADLDTPELRIWNIGKDSIAIIVHPTNPLLSLPGLTGQQVSNLFCKNNATGLPYYTKWSDLDPSLSSTTIYRVIRGTDSGTHDGFVSWFLSSASGPVLYFGNKPGNLIYDKSEGNNQDIETFFATNANAINAISYIGLGLVEVTPNPYGAVKLNYSGSGAYVVPSKANVKAGTYIIKRDLWYLTKNLPVTTSSVQPTGDPTTREAAQFISHVRYSPTFVESQGYIKALASDFIGTLPSGDTLASIHPPLPDGLVDFNDLIYFVDGYNAVEQGKLNPYCDFNADATVDFNDIIGFVDGYNAANP